MKFIPSKIINQAWLCMVLLGLCFALVGTTSAQNQYYVNSAVGNDSNDGSQARPWRTIQRADATLTIGGAGTCTASTNWTSSPNVGACVHVASGAYSGAITTNRSGSASARICYVSDTQYGAKLTGSSGKYIWGLVGSYTDVIGFEFDGTGRGTIGAVGSPPFSSATDGHFNRFISNKAHDITALYNVNSVFTSGGQPHNSYIGNLMYHVNGGAAIGPSTAGNAPGGIDMGGYDVVQNNVFIDIGGGFAIKAGHQSTNVIISNNTIVNSIGGGIVLGYTTVLADSSTISNNVIANSGSNGATGSGITVSSSTGCGPNNIVANNLMYGNTPLNYSNAGCGINATGTQSGSNSTTFVNYTGTNSGDYHLKSGSSAIGKGAMSCALSGCVPSVDFALTPMSSPPPIGAFTFGSVSANVPEAPTGLVATVN